MARHRSDREDLMAEAVTLTPRVSFRVADSDLELIAGLRTDGRLSLFFGSNEAFHFDGEGALRRAFIEGRLFRSQGTTLARLTRDEQPHQTVLLRHDLNDEELSEFRLSLQERLTHLIRQISENRVTTLQHIPDDLDFLPDLASLLQGIVQSGVRLSAPLKK